MGTNSAGKKVKKGKTKFLSKTAMHAVKNDTQVYYSFSFYLSLFCPSVSFLCIFLSLHS